MDASFPWYLLDIISVAEYILLVEKESGMTFFCIVNILVENRMFWFWFYCASNGFISAILVSVFQRLANDHFCRQNRCIVITVWVAYFFLLSYMFLKCNLFSLEHLCLQGRGYPDVPTRRYWLSYIIIATILLTQLYRPVLSIQIFAPPCWNIASACLLLGGLRSIWHRYLGNLQVWFNGKALICEHYNWVFLSKNWPNLSIL